MVSEVPSTSETHLVLQACHSQFTAVLHWYEVMKEGKLFHQWSGTQLTSRLHLVSTFVVSTQSQGSSQNKCFHWQSYVGRTFILDLAGVGEGHKNKSLRPLYCCCHKDIPTQQHNGLMVDLPSAGFQFLKLHWIHSKLKPLPNDAPDHSLNTAGLM